MSASQLIYYKLRKKLLNKEYKDYIGNGNIKWYLRCKEKMAIGLKMFPEVLEI